MHQGMTETTLNKLWIGSCTHCKGTLVLCMDNFGYYRKCINCGRTTGLPETAKDQATAPT